MFTTIRKNLVLTLALAGLFAALILLAGSVQAALDDHDHNNNNNDNENEKAEPAYVKIETNHGLIIARLNREKAPLSTENFLRYVGDEFYDGTIFHRVISNFMIQGGGFTEEMEQKSTRDPIRNEWQNGLSNERGTLAMARTNDPDSATSQFFINVVNNARLDEPIAGGAGYAVFGRVVHGMNVVDAIREVPTTTRRGQPNVPRDTVVMERVREISADEAEKLIEEAREEAPATRPQTRPSR